MNSPQISFVIPHKGREHFLEKTLASIAAQDAEENTEIVVVTQNEELSAATKSAAGAVALTVLHADPQLTIAASRNIGAREARGGILAFLDADIELSPDWLRKLLAILNENPDILLISGVQVCSEDAPALERIRTVLSKPVVDAPVAFLPGCNLLLRRQTFESVEGFPEHLVTCEDYYFADRVAAVGRLWRSGSASYVHLGEDRNLGEMFRKEIWRGQSNLHSLRGRRVTPGEWPSLLMPMWISGALVLCGAFLLLGFMKPALLAVLAAAVPFAAYVLRLYLHARGGLGLMAVMMFYGCYFPARAWGSLVGISRSVGSSLHDR